MTCRASLIVLALVGCRAHGQTIDTVAGSSGFSGFSGDGGLAIGARLQQPHSVAVDTAGNIYIADTENFRIRKVTVDSIITTFAGNGQQSVPFGLNGDGGAATQASFFAPWGVAVDTSGNVFIADTTSIRKIDPSGTISSIAGQGFDPISDGIPANQAQTIAVTGVAVDSIGNVYYTEPTIGRVRKISPAGIVSTLAGAFPTAGGAGFSGDGGPALKAQLALCQYVAVDNAGSVYISDSANSRIRKVTPDGMINTIAGTGAQGFSGDGGPASQAQLQSPAGLAIDGAGAVYIADTYRIRRITPDGIIHTVAGNGNQYSGGDHGPALTASFADPEGLAFDGAGNLYIAEPVEGTIRRVAFGAN